MATTRVTVTGDLNRLMINASLPQLEAVRTRAEQALQRNVPRDTGDLARSCYAKLDRRRGVVQLGADTPYARFVEYGFRHYASGEFIGPNAFVRRSYMEAIKATRGNR